MRKTNRKVQVKSKALGPNPKDILGAAKISLSKLPSVALLHAAHAMMNGADKYGAYNWRDKKVLASIYVDAADRHLKAWFEGQGVARDSRVHHLGHLIACAAILMDAEATGNLIDDRPVCGDPDLFDRVLAQLNEVVKETRAAAVLTKAQEKRLAKLVPHPHKVYVRKRKRLHGRRDPLIP